MESIDQYAEKSCSVLAITGRPRQMNVALSKLILNFEMMFNRIFNGKKDKCIT